MIIAVRCQFLLLVVCKFSFEKRTSVSAVIFTGHSQEMMLVTLIVTYQSHVNVNSTLTRCQTTVRTNVKLEVVDVTSTLMVLSEECKHVIEIVQHALHSPTDRQWAVNYA